MYELHYGNLETLVNKWGVPQNHHIKVRPRPRLRPRLRLFGVYECGNTFILNEEDIPYTIREYELHARNGFVKAFVCPCVREEYAILSNLR